MKVLLINCVYAKGSTGKILKDLKTTLESNGHECLVAYGRGQKIYDANVYKFCSELESKCHSILTRFGALQYGGNAIATSRLIRYIRNEKPDVVHVHCINGHCVNIYQLLAYLGKNKIKTVITHHAEFYYTGNCGHSYDCLKFTQIQGCGECPRRREVTGALFKDTTSESWKKMKQAFECFDIKHLIFTSVSPWVRQRALLSPIVKDFSNTVVKNGIDTGIFKYRKIASKDIFKGIQMSENIILLHVTAYFTDNQNSIKGGRYIIDLAYLMPQYAFVVVSPRIDIKCKLPHNVHLVGRASSQEKLAEMYSASSCTIITSKRETFSMICAESLCCGTPVVGFKAGGPETISITTYSKFVEQGDIVSLKSAISEFVSKNLDKDQIATQAIKEYKKEKMMEGYMDVYKQLFGK